MNLVDTLKKMKITLIIGLIQGVKLAAHGPDGSRAGHPHPCFNEGGGGSYDTSHDDNVSQTVYT